MQRFSISQLTSLRWSFHQDVVRYCLHGFSSLGVWRQKVEDCDILEVADYLHEMRMNVSSVHWAGGFTGGCGQTHADAILDGIEAIELTGKLNGECLIVHPGCRNGHTSTHARRLFRDALRELVPVAADYGVRLVVELMPCPSAQNWTFMKQWNCALELLSEFPEQQVGIVLDLYHVGLNAEVFDNLHQFSNRVALVQLADRNIEGRAREKRVVFGAGQVSFESWFQRLNDVGFSGVFEVELHGEGVSAVDYDERLRISRRFIESIGIDSIVNMNSVSNTEVAPRQFKKR